MEALGCDSKRLGADQFVSEVALEDLAGRVPRERIGPEPHADRDFEPGQPLGYERTELVFASVCPGLELHNGPDLLAEYLVGDADDGGVGDRGMLVQRRLDLDAVDVLAAADDHVLGPV